MMFGIDKFGIKLLFYFAGMALMSFGVVVSVISDSGPSEDFISLCSKEFRQQFNLISNKNRSNNCTNSDTSK